MIFLRNPILIEGIVIATVVMTTTHVLDAMCACLALWIMALPTALIVYPIKEKLPAYAKAIIYALVACVMYIPAYFILKTISQQAIADLTIYLPLLVLSELIMVHSEKSSKHRRFKPYALSTVMDLIGVSLVMFVVSALREILAYGTFFGITLELDFKLPMFALPFMGFIVVGYLCALTRWVYSKVIERTNRKKFKKPKTLILGEEEAKV